MPTLQNGPGDSMQCGQRAEPMNPLDRVGLVACLETVGRKGVIELRNPH
jgi:hypothetical protein